MRIHTSWIKPVLVLLVGAWVGTPAQAQFGPAPEQGYPPPGYGAPGYAPASAAPSGVMPAYGAFDPQSMGGQYPAANAYYLDPGYLPSQVMPAQAMGEMPAYGQYDGYSPYGDYGSYGEYGEGYAPEACPQCGGAGCDYCLAAPKGAGPTLGFWTRHGPYGTGLVCQPRWYDIHVEAMYLTRDHSGRRADLVSQGIAGSAPPNVVLSTENLDFDWEPGGKGTIAFVVAPGTGLEATYMGGFNWSSGASVTTTANNFYSVVSQFGNQPFNGFQDSDQAALATAFYSSRLDSVELNLRQTWVSHNCRFHGSRLAGVRYVRLDETLLHNLRVNAHTDPITTQPRGPAFANFRVDTNNDLVGFQLGGDLWLSLIPNVRVGADLDVGIYGNHAGQHTYVLATTIDPPLRESRSHDSAALVSEANVMAVWSLNSRLTLRVGYNFVYIDGVALATENFNTQPPFFTPRSVFVNDNGSVFLHGGTAGIEWTW